MIAIKGMDMPKSCVVEEKLADGSTKIFGNCIMCKGDYGYPVQCRRFHSYDLEKYIDRRHPNCPLTELPEENKDMSWEELVEKVKQLKSALLTVNEDYISYSAFEGCTHILEFGIDNQIVFRYADEEKIIHTDKSFYGMWVIIKALTGDER